MGYNRKLWRTKRVLPSLFKIKEGREKKKPDGEKHRQIKKKKKKKKKNLERKQQEMSRETKVVLGQRPIRD